MDTADQSGREGHVHNYSVIAAFLPTSGTTVFFADLAIMAFTSIVVNPLTGTELSYIDSGAPAQSSYITIFAIHGMIFTKGNTKGAVDFSALRRSVNDAIKFRGQRDTT
ncbi:uncharacterized protein BT62DRAFT_1077388 [Guyanagaster necrorhizus]|uniref:Uncharacterized protein n=1 Tax=Guyanagaster necrorhizus TaxID=856835 RepID=A0A9P7VQ88_9AGAR|nr:uncharacterized protein BT62DRAFT_1077388 [Guyanagaster necrorhizus MCA 3950]KAG7444597.1 hypothetical protein BT62DRAFT_1077388 [Guyanagaster necrorhizus MCA 3950]